MKTIQSFFEYTEYNDITELDPEDQQLVEESRKQTALAYAPYSDFYVGAAVLLDNGIIVKGNNQENSAYPSGLCAERLAVFAASAHYPESGMKTIAISARAKNFVVANPVTPCGACRQVMAEYESKQKNPIRVILSSTSGKILVIQKVSDLLPMHFLLDSLKK
ncbi:MAG: cytidine deaminase [Bacteroidales bacterium]